MPLISRVLENQPAFREFDSLRIHALLVVHTPGMSRPDHHDLFGRQVGDDGVLVGVRLLLARIVLTLRRFGAWSLASSVCGI
mgnify:CR=1 FL=1